MATARTDQLKPGDLVVMPRIAGDTAPYLREVRCVVESGFRNSRDEPLFNVLYAGYRVPGTPFWPGNSSSADGEWELHEPGTPYQT